MKAVEYLKGKKTYITLAIGIVSLIAVNVFGVELPGMTADPNWGNALVAMVAGVFLRAGVTKS